MNDEELIEETEQKLIENATIPQIGLKEISEAIRRFDQSLPGPLYRLSKEELEELYGLDRGPREDG